MHIIVIKNIQSIPYKFFRIVLIIYKILFYCHRMIIKLQFGIKELHRKLSNKLKLLYLSTIIFVENNNYYYFPLWYTIYMIYILHIILRQFN